MDELIRIAEELVESRSPQSKPIHKLRRRRKLFSPNKSKNRAYYNRNKAKVKRTQKMYRKKHKPELKRLRRTRYK